MVSIDKEYVHVINGQDSVMLDVYLDLYGIQKVREIIREDFLTLKKCLLQNNIEYKLLRNVLNPFAKAYSYFFNVDKLTADGYFVELNRKIVKNMNDKSNAILLGGDLIFSNNNVFIIKSILEDANINTDEFLTSNYCNLIVVGISDNTAKTIDEVFEKNVSAYKGFYNVTNPTHLKEYFMRYACQFSIKLGKKLIFSSPDYDDEECDYSGLRIKEDIELYSKYKLIPVPEDLYSTFLQFRPQLGKMDVKELLYSLNMFYDIENIEYPLIFVSDEKVRYINEHINSNFTKSELENEMEKSIRTNQISHMSYTYDNDINSIDFNVPYYTKSKVFTLGCKWNLDENKVEVITVIPNK